ncbi:dihydrofolate reductase [Hymenobacter taeanensis]|uniref:Dihydrofolate reductase n=1 Tax=Hymenobacter taeanensis TaxID=2735321 RepID=A0A6M6BM80_9BACT|nr:MULTISPECIES: dihydrofolate reductase [Hymenobacter]QJX49112.1 dihydrofolate reductase [Hymenobacter taeanensis]UOQ81364.1 dihydrofolate reductase [Hymenobacter sp. 5414T-23]
MTGLVVAVAQNGVIGGDNRLLWHLPLDLKHFKELTQGHPIVMGRRTYESIGRPLPNRTNIIVTRQPNWQAPGCEVAYSVPQALEMARALDEQVMVIGGGEIYRQALPAAEVVYLTEVHHDFEGDVTFPELSPVEWREETRERHEPDEKHAYPFSFVTLRRR